MWVCRGVIVIIGENGLGDTSSKSRQDCLNLKWHENTWKGINPTILPPAMGNIKAGWAILTWKTFRIFRERIIVTSLPLVNLEYQPAK